jgi:transmembrane sensor
LARKGLRRWLAAGKTHKRAFELATEIWDEAGALRGGAVVHLVRSKQPTMRVSLSQAMLASAAAVVVVVVGSVLWFHRAGVATGVGEQRSLTLVDGSRILLNTSTRVVVRYDKDVRHVELVKGEALFDVVKNVHRPFVVTAGKQQVTALGTSFDVRRDEHQVSVTLVEGKVAVAPVAELVDAVMPARTQVEVLHPGQRLTFAAGRAPRRDQPQMEKVTAWQRGQISLDSLSLADAVAEMNRYSIVQLQIERPEAAAVRVSGIFRAGDSLSFARAVAQTYGLTMVEQEHEILLNGVPVREPAE